MYIQLRTETTSASLIAKQPPVLFAEIELHVELHENQRVAWNDQATLGRNILHTNGDIQVASSLHEDRERTAPNACICSYSNYAATIRRRTLGFLSEADPAFPDLTNKTNGDGERPLFKYAAGLSRLRHHWYYGCKTEFKTQVWARVLRYGEELRTDPVSIQHE